MRGFSAGRRCQVEDRFARLRIEDFDRHEGRGVLQVVEAGRMIRMFPRPRRRIWLVTERRRQKTREPGLF